MKLSILAVAAVLTLGALPASAEPITCFRVRNIISCPGYGDFNYRSNNNRFENNRSENNRFDDDFRGDNRYQPINQIYVEILGRRADSEGARIYIQRLDNGWNLEQVRRDVAYSAEGERAINRAYLDILRRNVDPSGLETYRRYLASGRSMADVRRELANSREANRFR